MKKTDVAVEKFLSGYNCAQSVLYSYCDDLGLDPDTALKLACGFGAGMGRNQEVCGAISGGIMVLGLKYGRGGKGDKAATELAYSKTRELMERFSREHGTCICRTLLDNCDLKTAEGRKILKDNDFLNMKCKVYVQTVMHILSDLTRERA
jgi:C_GCAxxG_C_C family probable redox protein